MRRDVPERLAALLAVAVAGACLGPAAWDKARVAADVLSTATHTLATTTPAARRLAAYGDRDGIGYGYLSRIMAGFPDAGAAPLLRIPEADSRASVLQEGFRPRQEDRMLVGIGMKDADIREGIIARAERWTDTAWTFRTVRDFEVLTGFRFAFASAAAARMHVVLLGNTMPPRLPIGEWEDAIQAGSSRTAEFRLPSPVRGFSLGRGSTPFVVEISWPQLGQTPAPVLTGIDVLGVKVALDGYEIVNREPNCLTALRRDFLAEIRASPGHAWSRYLAAIQNVSRE